MAKIVINAVSAKSGGAASYAWNLARTWVARDGDHEYVFLVPGALAADIGSSSSRVRVVTAEIGSASAPARWMWDQWTLRRLCLAEKADVLLSSSDFGTFFPPCPQVLMVRNALFFSRTYDEEFLPYKRLRVRMEHAVRRRLVLRSIASSDVVMTATTAMMEDVRRSAAVAPEKAIVNHFGVPLEKFASSGGGRSGGSSATGGPFRILYVSEYGDYKNLAALLEAFLKLDAKNAGEYRLTVTMDPAQFGAVDSMSYERDVALATHPRVAEGCTFTGAIPYARIERLYGENDVFVFPSRIESFGHPLLEAMANGLAVVASDIPACREICGEAALYFDPRDSGELADHIERLRRDGALRGTLAKEGRRRVREFFDWDGHVRRLEMILARAATGE